MQIHSLLQAANSSDALQQAIGITMLKQVQDTQVTQAQVMLQDFAAAQHPYLGKSLDIRV